MDPVIHLLISWFTPSVGACYLGIAQAARDYAANWTGQRTQVPFDQPMSHYPHNQLLAAEMKGTSY